ncbi:Lsr2 family protein [Streptomyces sp. NBC_00536]|uniref:Lsr2 family DNA-binding protein n=1 Tax=Streptomyces sp. NBC_00536 TaxID=2975769 RepID=UPI002E80B974|nr:histone-like nucleoid-structuring protein Lsr2 [Streptomyces sp. NBC_00536]WUC83164.1 Lsr2 family protein [Streptomyces sp. NBC_00536]
MPDSDLRALTQICPPPATAPGPVNWYAVEAELGMPLPSDYKALAATYGPGRYADYLSVYHPHGVTEWVRLTGPMPARIRGQLQQDHDGATHPVPHDPRSLSAIGVTDNGEYLFWITEPERTPDRWRIAVNEARGPRWFTYDGTLTAFLASVLRGETTVPQFPQDLLPAPPTFTPSAPLPYEPPQTPARGPVDTDTIRAWATANGYQIPLRGRIPANIRQAWDATNPA